MDWTGATRTWCRDKPNVSITWVYSTETSVRHSKSSEMWPGQMRWIYQWGVIASPSCPCRESHQNTRHIVEECLLTALPGGLRRLHEACPDAVEWLSKLSMKLWECSKRATTNVHYYERQRQRSPSFEIQHLIKQQSIPETVKRLAVTKMAFAAHVNFLFDHCFCQRNLHFDVITARKHRLWLWILYKW